MIKLENKVLCKALLYNLKMLKIFILKQNVIICIQEKRGEQIRSRESYTVQSVLIILSVNQRGTSSYNFEKNNELYFKTEK